MVSHSIDRIQDPVPFTVNFNHAPATASTGESSIAEKPRLSNLYSSVSVTVHIQEMTRIIQRWVFLSTFWAASPIHSFTSKIHAGEVCLPSFRCNLHYHRIPTKTFLKEDDDDNKEGKERRSLDEFLDQSFFDPEKYQEDDLSVWGRLATFIKSDDELAETIYVGIIFVVLVIISQELLRMQIYGDQYTPFKSIGGLARNGKLF